MFLQRQFFFYRMYFLLVDNLKLVRFTWNPRKHNFIHKERTHWIFFRYILLFSNFLYMINATAIFAILLTNNNKDNFFLINITFHIFGLAVGWCFLLFRYMYTFETEDLVQFLNTILSLEKDHLRSMKLLLI